MKGKIPFIHLTFLLLMIMVAIYLFLSAEQIRIAANKLSAEVSLMEDNRLKLNGLATALPGLTANLSEWKSTMPSTEEEVARFAATIEQAARSKGLTIVIHFDDFPESADISGQKITGLGTDIVLDGSFQGVSQFLGELSGLPYFFKIDKMTMLKSESKVGTKTSLNGLLIMNR